MEELEKRRDLVKLVKGPEPQRKLWCGKIQALCNGNACQTCHLFPARSVENRSILSTPSLTDHKRIGLIRENEE